MPKLSDKLKELFSKKTKNPEDDLNSNSAISNPYFNSIVITSNYKNKNNFYEVVNLFNDELKKQLGQSIDIKNYILDSVVDGNINRDTYIRFIYPIPVDLPENIALLLNIIKKNVQLKIAGIKKYKDIQVVGAKTIQLTEPITNLRKIIKSDRQLNYDIPLYLYINIYYFTNVFDYNRYLTVIKKIDEYLDIKPTNYADAKKRIINAIEEIEINLTKETKLNKKDVKSDIITLSKQGAVKLCYIKNYVLEITDKSLIDISKSSKKTDAFLTKLANLSDFMKKTLNSKGSEEHLLLSYFKIATILNVVETTISCYAVLNDNTGINTTIINQIYNIAPMDDTDRILAKIIK